MNLRPRHSPRPQPSLQERVREQTVLDTLRWRPLVALTAVLLGLCLLCLAPSPAAAHHVPGHGGSEGVRSINSLGNRGGKVSSRLMLLDSLNLRRTSPTPGLRNDLSLLGEFAPLPAFSLGAQLPLSVVAEQGAATQVGLGDARAFLRWTPHADKLIHRTLTLNLSASFPTRTVRGLTDPGRIWSVSPSAIFTRTYGDWFWQVLAVASVETRPAGVALETSVGGQVGGKLFDGALAVGGGVVADVRLANWCAQPKGAIESCNRSRASEIEREPGATRATAVASASLQLGDRWSLIAGVQVPFTIKRDGDLGLTLGAQVVF